MTTLPYDIVIAKNGWKIDGKKVSHDDLKRWGRQVPERVKRHYDQLPAEEASYKQVAMAYELGNRLSVGQRDYCVNTLRTCCATRDLVRTLTPAPVRGALKVMKYVNPVAWVTGPVKGVVRDEILPLVRQAHKKLDGLDSAPVWQGEVANEVAGMATLLVVTIGAVLIGDEIEDALDHIDIGAIATFADHLSVAGVNIHNFSNDWHGWAVLIETPNLSVLAAYKVVEEGSNVLGKISRSFVSEYFSDNIGRFIEGGNVRFW